MVMGFRNLIKLPGKDFFNLSRSDAADMIDAYIMGGNALYEHAALPEFMLVPNPIKWLEELRIQIAHIDADKRTDDERDGLATEAGREDLALLSRVLRTS